MTGKDWGGIMRKGFTLMEIMVVIIVIAILSEVAMPMVTSIVDESRAVATKERMRALKSGLDKYRMDIGRYPHSRDKFKAEYINEAGEYFMTSASGDANPLISDSIYDCPMYFDYLGMASDKYARKWKGPYMETSAEDFFLDGWDGEIYYVYYNKAIWLHSYGADGDSASPTCFLPNNDEDDIVLKVVRLRF